MTAAKTHHPPGSHQGSQGCSNPRRSSVHRSRDRHWLGPFQHPLPKENSDQAHHNQHILIEKGNILPYRPVRGGSSGLIGKGTGQPRLDAESHGRNSPATTVRKQEGRELQGQQDSRSKITSKLKTEGRAGHRLEKQAPLSHPLFSKRWSSVWRGLVGWQMQHCSYSSPQLHGDPSISDCSPLRGEWYRQRGVARAQLSAPTPSPA